MAYLFDLTNCRNCNAALTQPDWKDFKQCDGSSDLCFTASIVCPKCLLHHGMMMVEFERPKKLEPWEYLNTFLDRLFDLIDEKKPKTRIEGE